MSTAGLPRRILLTTDAVGGVWTYSLAIAAGFIRLGCACVVAVLGPAPSAAQRREAAAIAGLRLIETGLDLDWTASHEASLAAAAARLDHIAAMAGVDTVHLHTPVLAAFAWRAGLVAVAHSCVGTWWDAVCGGPAPDGFAWRMRLMRRGLQGADIVIAPSAAFAAALRRVYGPIPPVRVVFNGVPPAAAPPVLSRRRRRVLTVGRLWDRGKNLALLDDVAASGGIAIDAAGPLSGADGTIFRPRHLNLLGTLSALEVQAACRRAAIFAAPARYEPFGLGVLEAAQQMTPLVLADIPTFRELWEGAAIFLSPDDPAAWSSCLRALLAAPAERDRLGRCAWSRAQSFSAEAMVAKTAEWHRSVHAAGPLPLLA
jgi:glycosyltransferase involved in cell wall biosynthesis